MIDVQVKLYASLRRYRPGVALGQAFTCTVTEGTSVAQLVAETLELPPDVVAIVLVNGIQHSPEYPLSAGDQVALFPPVAGGAYPDSGPGRSGSQRARPCCSRAGSP